ncbi:undecaprenyl-phosphate glucose phosphotransferase [Raoultella ornithinolytica]|uniref:undecaprenyl-phosphate glucose phosphotransferase n=1 Tax=Raoultella ornithinolytica TaxID=54291 RepID=UPI001265CD40|nr:undecaprenyl-phosphate glucose phosphotransferase [Raoultella ornithinolytica]KAB8152375.1 undecaprenyl-phosphate glucose phosphotransferase [Raoultella ornithinolytica]KAB8169426.1 undecaprenyl-phosphate glucose phosphotransferase [Raoultella ornithinolytica]QWU11860.1 undecaprenyl-phosphate glucose phosphotransferase [Raoultella ornithinolytica]
MKSFENKARTRPNASLISMAQRFSDIIVLFFGLYLVCLIHQFDFNYHKILLILVTLVCFQMIGGMTDFYRSWRGTKLSYEIFFIIKNWSACLFISLGVGFFFKINEIGIQYVFEWYLVVCIGFVLSRTAIRFLLGFVRHIGYNRRYIAIAGDLPVGLNLAKGFCDQPWLGLVVLGVYNDNEVNSTSEIPYLGSLEQLVIDAKSKRIDRIYISMPMSEELKIKKLISGLTDTTCSVILIPDIFTFNILQSRTEEINGIPVVPLFDTPLSGINMVIKRFEDIVLSIAILILISPVLVIISGVIKATSSGPVIFKQKRYGIDGKPIKVWKFRTMTVMEDGGDVVQATKKDARITPVGRFLRSTSLDELPQFINALRGEMSIVGPRPHAVAHNEQYRSLIQGYMLRHKVKPGITGWAQINGWRGETDTLEKMEKRIEYDLEYIRNWSVWFDLKIILLTIFRGFIHKSAY